MKNKTPKQLVLEKYQNATRVNRFFFKHTIHAGKDENSKVLGTGGTAPQAWSNAAKNIENEDK